MRERGCGKMENSGEESGKKTKLRERIFENARSLFNEQGYNNVSMRNIADSLGISVGNLTYHFRRKEALVEAVVLEQHKNYKKTAAPKTLEELHDCFKRVLGHQEKNLYYFHHYRQLMQLSPQIYQIQKSVIQDLHDNIESGFQNLNRAGMIKFDEIPGQSENLILTILSICAYGIVFSEINLPGCIWSLIYPLLTASGRSVYHSKIENDLK
jgi:AcrR family transcriptional regulator